MAIAENPKAYKVIGTRPVRHDGADKVTGRAIYGADLKLPGMIHGAIVRSPHAHAEIVSIDTSTAESMPGVRAIATNADFPEVGSRVAELGEGMFALDDLKENLLAGKKVLYKGHAVAAVAADTIHQARAAAQKIHVTYKPLPHVLDVVEAMQPEAAILHPDMRTKSMGQADSEQPTNIAEKFVHQKGDVEAGFAKAAKVIEREFRTATVHQGYIEPHNATALWNNDGRLTIWMSTQGSFTVREQLSGLLDLPLSTIKVVPLEIGGGFGGKIVVYLPPVAAILSKKSGKPVKLVMDRTEVLEATGPTPGSWMKVKLGADAEGRITAGTAELAFEAGAFKGSPVPMACMTAFACYDMPAADVVGWDVCLNRPATKAYRAPGATQAAFAVESVIDELCAELEVDPLDFRLLNASKEGTKRVDGPAFARIGMWETVDAIRNSSHWQTPLDKDGPGVKSPDGKRGRGVASGFWFNVGLKSSVTASVNPDGTVALIEGSTDIGGTRTSIAMQLAETLGITAEEVVPTVVDTDSVGYTDVTGGSRVTYSTGNAAYLAGMDIRRQLCERFADLWDVPAEEVQFTDGAVVGPKDGQRMNFRDAAIKLSKLGDPITGNGSSSRNEPGGAFGTHAVDVEVDTETGKVEVLRYTVAQDAGTAIHPSYVEGQMQGGAVQGIGWALNEEYFYDNDGVMRNSSFLDYRIPTSYDLPMIDTIIVEVPNPGHPYGVRGAGEVPIVPPPAAIANAIHDAIGIRMPELPMSPHKVLKAVLGSK